MITEMEIDKLREKLCPYQTVNYFGDGYLFSWIDLNRGIFIQYTKASNTNKERINNE
mgnify:FL=1